MPPLPLICRTPAEIKDWRRQEQGEVALVPTMGNLHAGHTALIKAARTQSAAVAVSIFVNPAQFGVNEDFGAYPRTESEDIKTAAAAGAAVIFAPPVCAMYPQEQDIWLNPGKAAALYEGKTRPGHFRGVLTVVTKLLHLLEPDIAVFGKKDYQQLFLIRQMVRQLNFPTRISAVPTERAADGLALSSRNQYLNAGERALAPGLAAALGQLKAEILSGGDFNSRREQITAELTAGGWKVDYIAVAYQDNLLPAVKFDRDLVILAAAKLGKTRLIDNLEVNIG